MSPQYETHLRPGITCGRCQGDLGGLLKSNRRTHGAARFEEGKGWVHDGGCPKPAPPAAQEPKKVEGQVPPASIPGGKGGESPGASAGASSAASPAPAGGQAPVPPSKPIGDDGEGFAVIRLAVDHDVVHVARLSEWGRLQVQATVHPKPGETLDAQIARAAKAVREAFIAEKKELAP